MPELNEITVWQCFETDEIANWEIRYDPSDEEDERVQIIDVEHRRGFRMSVESARAFAAMISAAVAKHDSDRQFERFLKSNTGEHKHG